jgi:hypothetical protein
MKTREKTWYRPLTLGKTKYETRGYKPGPQKYQNMKPKKRDQGRKP